MKTRRKNLSDAATRQAIRLISEAREKKLYGHLTIRFNNGKIVLFDKNYTEKVEEEENNT